MEDKYFQYVPLVGFPAACRELKEYKSVCSDCEDRVDVVPEGDFLDFFSDGSILNSINYFHYGLICAENIAVIGGLAYLVFR